ncbi:MAG: LCP family protein [Chloroflexi bacterium]|nr:LCP family protein [Chloroflexota bacterium]MCC6893804.1 LCP family protein [Anaerolineae bacterium]
MTEKRPSRVGRAIRFIVFWLVTIALVVAIGGFTNNTVQAVSRYINEQSQANQRHPLYAQTVDAIVSTLTTHTPTSTATSTATNTSTTTPSPTSMQTSTNTPTNTATFTATATLTSTPTATLSPTPEPILIAQAFETNTPRAIEVTIPALNTAVPIATELPTSTPTLTASPTVAAPVAATELPAVTLPAATTPNALPTPLLPDDADPNEVAPTAIPTKVPLVDRQGYDLVNIVLLGIDSELTGDNIDRTDTMIIVSINRTTNTVSMLSLPRDLYVYIPGWTMQRLNLAYTHGEQVGWTGGGFGLLRQTIFYNFGINVHYYIKVKLSGFKEIINTLGGVSLTVDCAIQDQELIGAKPPKQAAGPDDDGYYILPIGAYTLDGDGALWYARSRHTSIEFDRGRRQQQLLRAIWRAGLNNGQITQLPQLWSQLTQVVETDLKFEDMLGLLPYALSLNPDSIEHFIFQRLYHTTPWTPPDGANVQLPVPDTVRQLMEDFYTPPSQSQIEISGVTINVFNGTGNADWDKVAADRLGWSGFNAIAAGTADNTQYTDTVLIDHAGTSKGSKVPEVVKILNIKPENVRVEPDPNRTADYDIILGTNYSSCTYQVIQPGEEGG